MKDEKYIWVRGNKEERKEIKETVGGRERNKRRDWWKRKYMIVTCNNRGGETRQGKRGKGGGKTWEDRDRKEGE